MSGYVMVAVPADAVPEVARLVERHQANSSPSDNESGDELVNGWTPEDVRQAYEDSGDSRRSLLKHLATHADEEITSDQIAEAIGVADWNSVAGILGAFGRRCLNHYGHAQPPWKSRQDPRSGRYRMTMPANVAEVLRDAAGI